MRKLYLFANFRPNPYGGISLAMADDGIVLASHYCSSADYQYGDLYGNRPERKEKRKDKVMIGLPDISAVKEKINNDDILKDMQDYVDSSNSIPKFTASSMTNENVVEVLQFLTEEVQRLNKKVWNLLRLEQERLRGK